MTTFVLVHGAWGGGWIWRGVADELRRRGHVVFTPTLTGVGERSHLLGPDIDLDTQITDIVNVMKWEDLEDVVLVGHSYGGMVISGVAERMERAISSIVYLDAFYPDDGKSLSDYVGPGQAADHRKRAVAGEATPIPTWPAGENPTRGIEAKLTPHPAKCFVQPVKLTGARDRIAKKTYIYASGWQGPFKQFHDKLAADPSWRVLTVPCGHSVMLEMPERMIEILEEAV